MKSSNWLMRQALYIDNIFIRTQEYICGTVFKGDVVDSRFLFDANNTIRVKFF